MGIIPEGTLVENKDIIRISKNGIDLVNNNYDIHKFNEYIEKTMIIDW